MAGEANAAEFEGAAYGANYARAQGRPTEDRTEAYYYPREAVGGIFLPEPEKLRPPMLLHRFGDSTQPRERNRYGGWWMARETLELLARYAGDAETLVRIARQHLAVPLSFNAMDVMYTATLRQTLRAFGGVGGLVRAAPADAGGAAEMASLYPGGTELTGTPADRSMKRQLFIPGLYKVPDAVAFRPDRTVADWITAFHDGTDLAAI